MAKVTIRRELINPESDQYLDPMSKLVNYAVNSGATVTPNKNHTNSYIISDEDLTFPHIQFVLSVGGEIEDYCWHTTVPQDGGVSREIDGTVWYEYRGKTSEANFDIEQAKNDKEIDSLSDS